MAVFNYKERNNILLIILIVLGCCILYSLRFIAGSLLSTVIMYTIFRPVNVYLARKRLNRHFTAATIITSSLIIFVIPFYGLSLLVIDKITQFQKDPLTLRVITLKLDDFFGSKLHQPDMLQRAIGKASSYAADLFPSIIGGAADLLLGIVVMYFLLYFMFINYETFERQLLRYSPFREQNALKFAAELKYTTYSNILGQGLIAIVQGSLVSIGFFIFDLPDAIFWGVISVFLSFLPLIGAAFVFVPAGFIAIAGGDKTNGIGILVWGILLVSNIDNVIRFLIARQIGNIHPIITVIGVIIGIPTFGIMGLVLGPLLLSYFILTVKIYETSKLASDRLDKIRSSEEE
ncbi:AI-2E family transporter [Arcticibacter sp. MXS-1]|uniref:AI-2E family transporter n=1 Tax=Arcticibacter sp. MXS-1 TaxID=3341726 RepID=UPI0035A85B2A